MIQETIFETPVAVKVSLGTVYPVGYSALGAEKRVEELMSDPKMLLIDTRLKPWSWRTDWQEKALREKYGDRYRVAGKCLGNLNYQGGPIKLANPEVGIKGLVQYFSEGHNLILICQCTSLPDCHMHVICELLQETMPEVKVVTFGQVEKQNVCVKCGAPSELQSPSGTLYCQQHGYCGRMNGQGVKVCCTSVEKFVKHPVLGAYVCPCVIRFEQEREGKSESGY